MLCTDRILTPVDWGAAEGPALTHALFLADALHATLDLVHVSPPASGDALPASAMATPAQSPDDRMRRTVASQIRRTSFPGADPHPTLHSAHIESDSVAAGLLDYIETNDIRLIVAGPNPDRGPVPPLKSSVIAALIENAGVPILTVGAAGALNAVRFRQILVPIDFSRASQCALKHAKALAALYDATLDILHIMDRPQYVALNATDMLALSDATLPERQTKRRLQTFVEETPGPSVTTRLHVAHGDAAAVIGSFANEHHSDLVVLSSHGQTRQREHPLGTVAGKLVRRLPQSMFIVNAFGPSLIADASSDPTTNGRAPSYPDSSESTSA
jgi:nucleotide-binding universal stress UspA family protein